MKKIFDFRILIIIVLCIVLGTMCYLYLNGDSEQNEYNITNLSSNDFESQITNESADNQTIIASSQVLSSLEENVELHATYYLEECYVKVNQKVIAGENILKYTNGEYFVAPYDCVISEINIPNIEGKCTNEHYIKIASLNYLKVEFNVDETKIEKVKVGQNAKISISVYNDKSFDAYITKISSTASSGKFTVDAEFENSGDVLLGMTANVLVEVEN